jgi:hypothetical protein
MDEDNSSYRPISGQPEFSSKQHERTGSMSLGAAANPNGDEVSPINGDSAAASTVAPQPAPIDPNARAARDVINSEVRAASQDTTMFWKLTAVLRSVFKPFSTVLSKV